MMRHKPCSSFPRASEEGQGGRVETHPQEQGQQQHLQRQQQSNLRTSANQETGAYLKQTRMLSEAALGIDQIAEAAGASMIDLRG